MRNGDRYLVKLTSFVALLACLLVLAANVVLAAEKERINPPGVFKHPNFTRVITVKGPGKMIFGCCPAVC